MTLPVKNDDLSLSKKTIAQAIKSQLVNDISDILLRSKLLLIFRQAHIISGIKAPEDIKELNLTLDAVISELRENKCNIRVDELEKAILNGVNERYGDYFGLNAKYYIKFIYSYVVDPKRLDVLAIDKKEPQTLLEAPKIRREERLSFAQKAYQKYLADGRYEDYGNLIFDYLNTEKLITFTNKEKNEFVDQARFQISQKLMNATTLNEKRKNNIKLEMLMESDTSDVIILAKKITVEKYFEIINKLNYKEIPFDNG